MNRWSLHLAWLGFVGLFALQWIWHGPAALTQPGQRLALLISALPLLAVLLYARRQPRRGLLLGGMLALFYFCHAVSEAWVAASAYAALLAWVEITCCLFLILGLGAQTILEKRLVTRTSSSRV